MKLLLAEDETILREALVTILNHSGYTVDAVEDGRAANDYLLVGGYDAAILDIMMPKMDGISVLKELRSRGSTLPVLLLTAKSEIDDRVAGLDAGADDYLTKPFAAKELLARIRAITRRQPELSGTDLTLGNITLSRGSMTLNGPEGSVRLANKEFQMLELLLNSRGQVISAEQFMEKIWGFDAEAEINVVWVNISGLRRKLTGVGGNVRIRASRGAGYILEEIPC